MVPRAGLEPTRLSAADLKSAAATNYATRAKYFLEVTTGFAPVNNGFADRRVRLLHHVTV
jgi:hypothetical protein